MFTSADVIFDESNFSTISSNSGVIPNGIRFQPDVYDNRTNKSNAPFAQLVKRTNESTRKQAIIMDSDNQERLRSEESTVELSTGNTSSDEPDEPPDVNPDNSDSEEQVPDEVFNRNDAGNRAGTRQRRPPRRFDEELFTAYAAKEIVSVLEKTSFFDKVDNPDRYRFGDA